MQQAFCKELSKELLSRGITTVLETCGFGDFNSLYDVASNCTEVLFDLKVIDPEKHRQMTGMDNRVILENARGLVERGIPVIFRIPLIPEITATKENMQDTANFLQDIHYSRQVILLPYHQFGMEKYECIGKAYLLSELKPLDDYEMNKLATYFEPFNIPVAIGGQASV